MKRNKYISLIFVTIFIFLLSGCSVNNKTSSEDTSKISVKQDELVIATFSYEGKSNLLLLGIDDKSEKSLVLDRQVQLTGDISSDKNQVVYTDALGDDDPWQVYLKNMKDDKIFQVTDNKEGKVCARVSTSDLVYFLTIGDSNGVMKIAKADIKNKSAEIIDKEDRDRAVQCFDIRNNKIVMVTYSESERMKSWKENGGANLPREHVIYELNADGSNIKKIATVKASLIESVSYTKNFKNIIIGGENINGDSGVGFYKINVEDSNITCLLNNTIIKEKNDSKLEEIHHPRIAVMASDEDTLYFIGKPRDSIEVDLDGLKDQSANIFSYNTKTKEIKVVFVPEVYSVISDLNIKY